MARLDPSRTAVEVDEHELSVAKLMLDTPGDVHPRTEEGRAVIAELERAGISVDRVIAGYPARVLTVVLHPELRLVVERFASDTRLCDVAAVAGGIGVWGEKRSDGATEFTPIEPELIPWQVARAVGLGPRAHSRETSPLEFRARTLDAALERMVADDIDAAARELAGDPGLDNGKRDVLMEVLILRRLSWRAVSVWADESGKKHAAGVAVVDGGDAGLWLSNHTSDRTEDAVVRLTPTDSGDVWDRIVGLVPYPQAVANAG